jgi:Virulence-associated protein E
LAAEPFKLFAKAGYSIGLEGLPAMPVAPATPEIDICITNLPAALAPLIIRDNWVLWKWEVVKGKRTKVPYQPNGAKAKSNDATTWSSYSQSIDAVERFDGIGYCLDDDIAAFDIDNCRDPDTKILHPWAAELVERAGSYTEVTISGTGIRIIGFGNGEKIHKKQKVDATVSCESYRKPAGRYIVVTGAQIGDRAIVNIDTVMDEVVAQLTAQASANGGHGAGDAAGAYIDELLRTIADGGGDRHGGSRSENVWWVIMEMMRHAYARETIKDILTNPINAISEHVREQSNPRQYLDRQITRSLESLEFSCDRSGKKYPTASNICIAVSKIGLVIRIDEFSGRTLIKSSKEEERSIRDSDVIIFRETMERAWQLKAPKDLVFDVLMAISVRNKFHPVKEYLESLVWDGVSRVDRWLMAYFKAEYSEYVKEVGRLVLVAAVRRVYQPGCKFDEIMVLESEQGTEKSSALAVMAVKDEWFSDNLPLGAANREVLEYTSGKWIIEVSELAGMRRAEVEHVKAFASRQFDRGRPAYGRIVDEVPRKFIMIGTTNNETYLRDSTGNRRFWPIGINEIKIEDLKRDRDQLWAEAKVISDRGDSIRLSNHLWSEAEAAQENRLASDPYMETLAEKLEGFDNAKIRFNAVLSLITIPEASRNQDHSQRIAQAMRLLGWKKAKVKHLNQQSRGYTKGDEPFGMVLVKDNATAYFDNDVLEEARQSRFAM